MTETNILRLNLANGVIIGKIIKLPLMNKELTYSYKANEEVPSPKPDPDASMPKIQNIDELSRAFQ